MRLRVLLIIVITLFVVAVILVKETFVGVLPFLSTLLPSKWITDNSIAFAEKWWLMMKSSINDISDGGLNRRLRCDKIDIRGNCSTMSVSCSIIIVELEVTVVIDAVELGE